MQFNCNNAYLHKAAITHNEIIAITARKTITAVIVTIIAFLLACLDDQSKSGFFGGPAF